MGYCLPTRENAATIQIPEHDKELIRELKRNFSREVELFFQEANATVIAVYRAIVDLKIADENTLKTAQDCLNEWNQSPRKYPNFSHYENMSDIWDIPRFEEKRSVWNRWTSGCYGESFTKMKKFMDEKDQLLNKIIQDTAIQLSQSTKRLQSNNLYTCFFDSRKAKCFDLFQALMKYIQE